MHRLTTDAYKKAHWKLASKTKLNDTACLESRKIGRNYTKAETKFGKGQRQEKPVGCLMNELLF